MKALTLISTLLCLASCQNHITSTTSAVDSVLVAGEVMPTEVAVKILLPANKLDNYRVGQTITCGQYGQTKSLFGGSIVLVEDTKGIPVKIRSLTPQPRF